MKNSGFLLLALLFLFSACHPWDHPADDDTQLTRTVLVYMVAENSLSYGNFHEQDLNELLTASGEIPSKCHLLVYVDDTDTPRLYLVENGSTSSKPRLLKQWTEDMNSCATETLRQMMEIMTTLLPSKSYGLVFWSHGNAWLPGSRTAANNRKAPASLSAPRSEPQRTIGIDNGGNSFSNTGSKMEISELAEVLSDFPKLSFLMFDACFMQTIEVAYELRNVTDYVIASPAETEALHEGAEGLTAVDPQRIRFICIGIKAYNRGRNQLRGTDGHHAPGGAGRQDQQECDNRAKGHLLHQIPQDTAGQGPDGARRGIADGLFRRALAVLALFLSGDGIGRGEALLRA